MAKGHSANDLDELADELGGRIDELGVRVDQLGKAGGGGFELRYLMPHGELQWRQGEGDWQPVPRVTEG